MVVVDFSSTHPRHVVRRDRLLMGGGFRPSPGRGRTRCTDRRGPDGWGRIHSAGSDRTAVTGTNHTTRNAGRSNRHPEHHERAYHRGDGKGGEGEEAQGHALFDLGDTPGID